MDRFSNPFRAAGSRAVRRQSARFAPEMLEGRLSPSAFGLTSAALVDSAGALNGDGGGGTEPPPPDGDGEVPDIPPGFPYGPWHPR